MNHWQYSAHHYEREVLLQESTSVTTLAVEELKVNCPSVKEFDGETIQVVYLFSTGS